MSPTTRLGGQEADLMSHETRLVSHVGPGLELGWLCARPIIGA